MATKKHTTHVKLQGGSTFTAHHDLERMRTAREDVQKANKAEAERAGQRRGYITGDIVTWLEKVARNRQYGEVATSKVIATA